MKKSYRKIKRGYSRPYRRANRPLYRSAARGRAGAYAEKRSPFIWIFPVFSLLAAVGILPLNLFLYRFPEWVAIPAACVVFLSALVMCIRGRRHPAAKLLLSVGSAAAIAAVLLGSYCNPYWNSIQFAYDKTVWYGEPLQTTLTFEQAKSDVDTALHYLQKVHPKFYRAFPQEVRQRYDAVIEELRQAETITVGTVAQSIQSICYPLKDAHTHIAWNMTGERYMKYLYRHTQAGDTLCGVNGQTWEQMLEPTSPYAERVSYEVKAYGMQRLASYTATLDGLAYLGISAENGVIYHYETAAGEKINQYAAKEDFLPYDEYAAYNQIPQDGAADERFVFYDVDEERSAAVLTLRACQYTDEYKTVVRRMFEEVRQKNIRRVAVDLRENGGGNSLVANEFLRYLDVDTYRECADEWRLGWFLVRQGQSETQNKKYEDLLFRGELYILTSADTFSSAMMFAEYVKDNRLGTIIGETPGNAPDSCGDIAVFRMPHSGLLLQISSKQFHRIDDIDGLIEPDIPCAAGKAMETFYAAAG